MSVLRPRGARRAALLAAGVALAAMPPVARGQAWLGEPEHRTATGRDFPSWERRVDATDLDPLPAARKGHWVPAVAAEVGGIPTGVVSLRDGTLAVPLLSGDVVFVGADSTADTRVASGATLSWAPASIGVAAVVAGPAIAAAVARDGVLWSRQLPSEPVRPVDVFGPLRDPVILLCRTGGLIERLDPLDGTVRWSADVGGEVSAAPAWLPGLVVVGTGGGAVVGLDADAGTELWRTTVGQAIGGLVADREDVFGTSHGPTPRSRRNDGPFAFRLPLLDGGRRIGQTRWRLRLGGEAFVAPLLLDAVVGFPTRDGYVHGIERGRGTEAWRMDLPAVVQQPPVQAAGRLDFVLALTPWLVSLSAETGGVMGWTALEDPDELFVGTAASARGLTFAATTLGRVVGFRFDVESQQPHLDPRLAR